MSMTTVASPSRQQGAVLLLFALMLLVGASALVVGAVSQANLQINREKITTDALSRAKDALIAYAVTPEITGATRPGQLPCPDTASEAPIPNYDGRAGTTGACNAAATAPRLGRLPWRSGTGCVAGSVQGLAVNLVDGSGERLWYAVSRNLVDLVGVPTLNPDLLQSAPYPWLSVRDSSGAILNARVAAVILSPGGPIPGQNRAGTVADENCVRRLAAGAAQFLDNVTIAGTNYSNADANDCRDNSACPTIPSRNGEDFIMATPSNTFNDRLIYITIDELMAAAEKRAAGQAGSVLRSYFTNSSGVAANRFYPYAASLAYQSGESCLNNQTRGSLPLPVCTCTSAAICDCAFPGTFTFQRNAGNFTATTGACTLQPIAPPFIGPPATTCQCTGAGTCSDAGGQTLVCNAYGTCFSSVAGKRMTFVGSKVITANTGACTGLGSTTSNCTGAGSTIVDGGVAYPNPVLTGLPNWYHENGWRHFQIYSMATSCTAATPGCGGPGYLTVGASANIHAALIAASTPVTAAPFAFKGSAQIRPSANIDDYFDSQRNICGFNSVAGCLPGFPLGSFDGVGQPTSPQYNDRTTVVAP